MAVYFSGVNTGRNYEVGQTYRMGNDTYVAQPDGSFTNQQTGRNFVGSSNPTSEQTVSWYSDGDQYSSGRAMAAADYQPVIDAIAAQKVAAQNQLQAGSGSVVSGAALQAGVAPARSSGGVTATPALIASASAGRGVLSSLFSAIDTFKYADFNHVIQDKPPVDGVVQIHGSKTQRAVPIVGDLIWYYPNEYYADVADFWEDHMGELGEYVGGAQVLISGILNSVPRNIERHAKTWGAMWNTAVTNSSKRDYERVERVGRSLGLNPLTEEDVLGLDPTRFQPLSAY